MMEQSNDVQEKRGSDAEHRNQDKKRFRRRVSEPGYRMIEQWNDVQEKKTRILLNPIFHHSIIPIVSEAN